MKYILSLGSNIPDRLGHLVNARQAIERRADCSVDASSKVYETEPVDVLPEHQDKPFLNAALLVSTTLTPVEFSKAVHQIEDNFGRERSATDKNAPRPIDIDLVAAGDTVVDLPGLKLPHSRWHERRFVVQPVNDLCPDIKIPGQTRSVAEILKALPPRPIASPFAEQW